MSVPPSQTATELVDPRTPNRVTTLYTSPLPTPTHEKDLLDYFSTPHHLPSAPITTTSSTMSGTTVATPTPITTPAHSNTSFSTVTTSSASTPGMMLVGWAEDAPISPPTPVSYPRAIKSVTAAPFRPIDAFDDYGSDLDDDDDDGDDDQRGFVDFSTEAWLERRVASATALQQQPVRFKLSGVEEVDEEVGSMVGSVRTTRLSVDTRDDGRPSLDQSSSVTTPSPRTTSSRKGKIASTAKSVATKAATTTKRRRRVFRYLDFYGDGENEEVVEETEEETGGADFENDPAGEMSELSSSSEDEWPEAAAAAEGDGHANPVVETDAFLDEILSGNGGDDYFTRPSSGGFLSGGRRRSPDGRRRNRAARFGPRDDESIEDDDDDRGLAMRGSHLWNRFAGGSPTLSAASARSAPMTHADAFDPESYLGADAVATEEYRRAVDAGLRRAITHTSVRSNRSSGRRKRDGTEAEARPEEREAEQHQGSGGNGAGGLFGIIASLFGNGGVKEEADGKQAKKKRDSEQMRKKKPKKSVKKKTSGSLREPKRRSVTSLTNFRNNSSTSLHTRPSSTSLVHTLASATSNPRRFSRESTASTKLSLVIDSTTYTTISSAAAQLLPSRTSFTLSTPTSTNPASAVTTPTADARVNPNRFSATSSILRFPRIASSSTVHHAAPPTWPEDEEESESAASTARDDRRRARAAANGADLRTGTPEWTDTSDATRSEASEDESVSGDVGRAVFFSRGPFDGEPEQEGVEDVGDGESVVSRGRRRDSPRHVNRRDGDEGGGRGHEGHDASGEEWDDDGEEEEEDDERRLGFLYANSSSGRQLGFGSASKRNSAQSFTNSKRNSAQSFTSTISVSTANGSTVAPPQQAQQGSVATVAGSSSRFHRQSIGAATLAALTEAVASINNDVQSTAVVLPPASTVSWGRTTTSRPTSVRNLPVSRQPSIMDVRRTVNATVTNTFSSDDLSTYPNLPNNVPTSNTLHPSSAANSSAASSLTVNQSRSSMVSLALGLGLNLSTVISLGSSSNPVTPHPPPPTPQPKSGANTPTVPLLAGIVGAVMERRASISDASSRGGMTPPRSPVTPRSPVPDALPHAPPATPPPPPPMGLLHQTAYLHDSVAASATGVSASASALERQLAGVPTIFYRNGVFLSVGEPGAATSSDSRAAPGASGSNGNAVIGATEYTQYRITVRLLRPNLPGIGNPSPVTFKVTRRYREFRAFYFHLVSRFSAETVAGWPEFPRKSFFDRFSPTTIATRLSSFSTLLTFVSLHPALYNCPPLLQFLGLDTSVPPAPGSPLAPPATLYHGGEHQQQQGHGTTPGVGQQGNEGGVVLYENGWAGAGSQMSVMAQAGMAGLVVSGNRSYSNPI
ncbi:hypothetical protein HK101_001270 [Irineochytrium annulatum]|nr:hypothetical protein HK101_001270 [Irineochytrium annulatum]